MNNNYKESFEQTKIAGNLAAQALDEVTSYVQPGITTNKLDKICYEFIKDNKGYSAPLFKALLKAILYFSSISFAILKESQSSL